MEPQFGALHIPVSLLWEYTLDASCLVRLQLEHLTNCGSCISVLVVCQVSKSLDFAKEQLENAGVTWE
jgi:hypothetical protein